MNILIADASKRPAEGNLYEDFSAKFLGCQTVFNFQHDISRVTYTLSDQNYESQFVMLVKLLKSHHQYKSRLFESSSSTVTHRLESTLWMMNF